jgi:hypothetical protein
MRKRGRRDRGINIFKKWNLTIEDGGLSRMFIARFGDIEKIRPHGDGEATVYMKNGEKYDVSGGADDVTSKIHVNDESFGEMELHWDRIETIDFMKAPDGADPGVHRLYGKLETREGDYEGYIQWDKQECLSNDLLDGDTEDGDVSLKMGSIRSIERKGKRVSEVTLKDGRNLRMRGTNDVNSDNRGIMVEDPRFGRVTVQWDAFMKLTFTDAPGTGVSYGDYKGLGRLRGVVTDDRGDKHEGFITIDLDEAEGWEMLNGQINDIHFDIPLYMVASIEPLGRDECVVTLHNGERIELEEGTDVSDRNAGVLVYDGKDDSSPVYISWRDVEMIKYDR